MMPLSMDNKVMTADVIETAKPPELKNDEKMICSARGQRDLGCGRETTPYSNRFSER